MGLYANLKYRQFWNLYFIYRFIIFVFDIFVYSKMTSLGDTERYLHGVGGTATNWLLNSTAMMDFFGAIIGKLTLYNMFFANLPFMVLSFMIIRWAIEKTNLRRNIPSILLYMLLCLPNFCVWTTIYSKEFVGLVISAIFGVLFFRYFKGDFKLKWIDFFATYLCLLFKPQYLPFIFQGLFYIFIARKFLKSAESCLTLALVVLVLNVCIVIAITPLINQLASVMYIHFNVDGTSTRPNVFVEDGDFFKHMPTGIIIAFLGPTYVEMVKSPFMMIAGLEGLFMIGLFVLLSAKVLKSLLNYGRLSPVPLFSILITTLGLLFIHYPFGIFNPGSAIRYRTNFLFLFMLLLGYLYSYYGLKKKKNENCILR